MYTGSMDGFFRPQASILTLNPSGPQAIKILCAHRRLHYIDTYTFLPTITSIILPRPRSTMLLRALPLTLLALVTASIIPKSDPQYIFNNPPIEDASHFPTIHESTVQARRILHLSTIGTLVTTFPKQSSSKIDRASEEYHATENRPTEVEGSPIGLMEYYADCEPTTGNPTLLAINIATPFKNYAEGSNISLSVRWWPIETNHYFATLEDPSIPTPHTPAALPRFSLHGHLEPISLYDLLENAIPACFLQQHPDSLLWQPGNDIHTSRYMRLIVEEVYWFGGFGDRARIGWLPIEEWRNVTMEEIAECRLPGEKKTKQTAKASWWHQWL
jgi:hypothetical protein